MNSKRQIAENENSFPPLFAQGHTGWQVINWGFTAHHKLFSSSTAPPRASHFLQLKAQARDAPHAHTQGWLNKILFRVTRGGLQVWLGGRNSQALLLGFSWKISDSCGFAHLIHSFIAAAWACTQPCSRTRVHSDVTSHPVRAHSHRPPLSWRLKGLAVNHCGCWHQRTWHSRVCSLKAASGRECVRGARGRSGMKESSNWVKKVHAAPRPSPLCTGRGKTLLVGYKLSMGQKWSVWRKLRSKPVSVLGLQISFSLTAALYILY